MKTSLVELEQETNLPAKELEEWITDPFNDYVHLQDWFKEADTVYLTTTGLSKLAKEKPLQSNKELSTLATSKAIPAIFEALESLEERIAAIEALTNDQVRSELAYAKEQLTEYVRDVIKPELQQHSKIEYYRRKHQPPEVGDYVTHLASILTFHALGAPSPHPEFTRPPPIPTTAQGRLPDASLYVQESRMSTTYRPRFISFQTLGTILLGHWTYDYDADLSFIVEAFFKEDPESDLYHTWVCFVQAMGNLSYKKVDDYLNPLTNKHESGFLFTGRWQKVPGHPWVNQYVEEAFDEIDVIEDTTTRPEEFEARKKRAAYYSRQKKVRENTVPKEKVITEAQIERVQRRFDRKFDKLLEEYKEYESKIKETKSRQELTVIKMQMSAVRKEMRKILSLDRRTTEYRILKEALARGYDLPARIELLEKVK